MATLQSPAPTAERGRSGRTDSRGRCGGDGRGNMRSQRRPLSVSEIQDILREKIGGNLRTIRRVLRLFDLNQTGLIHRQDLHRILDHYCVPLTDRDFSRFWKAHSPGCTVSYDALLERLGFEKQIHMAPVCSRIGVCSRGSERSLESNQIRSGLGSKPASVRSGLQSQQNSQVNADDCFTTQNFSDDPKERVLFQTRFEGNRKKTPPQRKQALDALKIRIRNGENGRRFVDVQELRVEERSLQMSCREEELPRLLQKITSTAGGQKNVPRTTSAKYRSLESPLQLLSSEARDHKDKVLRSEEQGQSSVHKLGLRNFLSSVHRPLTTQQQVKPLRARSDPGPDQDQDQSRLNQEPEAPRPGSGDCGPEQKSRQSEGGLSVDLLRLWDREGSVTVRELYCAVLNDRFQETELEEVRTSTPPSQHRQNKSESKPGSGVDGSFSEGAGRSLDQRLKLGRVPAPDHRPKTAGALLIRRKWSPECGPHPPVPRPKTGLDRRPGTGLDQRPGTGLDQRPGTGLDQRPGTGLDQMPGTGLDQRPGTGLDQRPGTGLDQRPGTGQDQRPGTGRQRTSGAAMDQDLGEKRLMEHSLIRAVRRNWRKILKNCTNSDSEKQGWISTETFIKILESFQIRASEEQLLAVQKDSVRQGQLRYHQLLQRCLLDPRPGTGTETRTRLRLPLPTQQSLVSPGPDCAEVMLRIYPTVRSCWTPLRRDLLAAGRDVRERRGAVSVDVFKKVLCEWGLALSEDDWFHLLSHFDPAASGSLCYNSFLWAFLH